MSNEQRSELEHLIHRYEGPISRNLKGSKRTTLLKVSRYHGVRSSEDMLRYKCADACRANDYITERERLQTTPESKCFCLMNITSK